MNTKKEIYVEWLRKFDLSSEALKLKVRHIENVVKFASGIAKNLNMKNDDIVLAEFIAQHHDDGRFPQWTKYNTFNDKQVCADGQSHPHTQLSIDVLFSENRIHDFATDMTDEELEIVKKAISRHGDLVLKTDDLTDRELVHCQVIRDADMLDNLANVKLGETVENLMKIQGFTLKQLEESTVTKEVFDTFCANKAIDYSIVKTPADWWLTWTAYIYNLSLAESLKVVDAHMCIERIFDRLNGFENDETKELFDQARRVAVNFMAKKCPSDALKNELDIRGQAVVAIKSKMFMHPSCDPCSRRRYYTFVYYLKRDSQYLKMYLHEGKHTIEKLDEAGIDFDSYLVSVQKPVLDDRAKFIKWERVLLLEHHKAYFSVCEIVESGVVPEELLLLV